MRAAILLLLMIPLALGHVGEMHATEEQAKLHEAQTRDSINPITYFRAGEMIAGGVALMIWLLAVMALSVLSFPLLRRIFEF